MPVCTPDYVAPRWALGTHIQTIFPAKLARLPRIAYRRERWETPDADFLDIDWTQPEEVDPTTPILVHFHGLEGNSRAHYALALMEAAVKRGWRGCVPHLRGCSGEQNRKRFGYHAGSIEDVEFVLKKIKDRFPMAPVYAVGVSLGGNLLALWLGKTGARAKDYLTAGAAIGATVDLMATAGLMKKGFNRVYTTYFLLTMVPKALEKIRRHPELAKFLDSRLVKKCRSLYDFDKLFTAPVNGFKSIEEYAEQTSAKFYLKNVQVPLLMLNAKNDTFLPSWALPTLQDISEHVWLDQPEEGGHVGFPRGAFPGQIDYAPNRVLRFFDEGK